jgi:hypothetical protein
MAIVIFELDGDTDEKACQLQFAKKGRKIKVYSRIPSELTKAESLLGNTTDRSSVQDADCMLLDLSIKERLQGSRRDSNGDYWEIREVIDLPYQCKNSIFNKHRREIPTYLLRKNDQGYAWGYFWVVGSHVGQRDKSPTKIRCQTSSDTESDEVDENQSHLFSSDEEQADGVEAMEIEFESLAIPHKNDCSQNYRRLKEGLENEICKLKKSLQQKTNEALTLKSSAATLPELEKQLRSRNGEIIHMKEEMARLKELLERRQHEIPELDEQLRSKNEEIIHMNEEMAKQKVLLERKQHDAEEILCKLNAVNEQLISKNDEMNKLMDCHMTEIANLTYLFEEEKKKCIDVELQASIQQSERAELLRKLSFLEDEYQAKERGSNNTLGSLRQHINQLETEIKRLRVDNQLKQKLFKELELSSQKNEDEHIKSKQVLKENHATMEKMLEESNNKIAILLNEAKRDFETNEKNLKASVDRAQEMEKVLAEQQEQCVYQMDQIQRLRCHLHENEQTLLHKDSLIQTHQNEINGLKNHILHQGNT